MSVDSAGRPKGVCRSWPHCSALADAPGGRFCLKHQEALNRVQAICNPRLFNKQGKADAELAPAEMTVRWVAPTAEPPTGAKTRRERIGRDEWRSRILGALKDGPLASGALAEACLTTPQDRSYGRHRKELYAAGVIVEVPGRPGRGSGRCYAIAPPAVAA